MPNIIEGMIQLDSKWVDGQPILPSILISKLGQDTNGYITPETTVKGTELLWFIDTYYGGLYSTLDRLMIRAETDEGYNTRLYTPTYSYYGYVEDSRLDITFSVEANSTGKYVYFDAVWYNADGITVMGSVNTVRLEQGYGDEAFKNLRNRKTSLYLGLYSEYYDRDSANGLQWYYPNLTITTPNRYTSLGQYDNTVVNYLFYYPSKEKEPDGDIGVPEVSGTNKSVDIDIPELPQLTILNGFHNMYNPDIFDIKGVSKSLWSLDFTTNFLKVFSNPIDSIVSLALSPIQPPLDETKSAIYVGNLPMLYKEGEKTVPVTSRTLSNQYGQYSFGKIMLFEEYGNYLDYDTKVELYIPYISVVQLNVEDVMNSTIELVYNVDFFTGDFIAFLKCGKLFGANSVLYHWKGNLLKHIPITSNNYAQTIMTGLSTVFSLPQGNIGGAITNTLQSLKPSIEKGTVTSGGVGSLDNFEAYIILSKPVENKPANYNILKGTPSNKKVDLVQGLGYIECEEIHIKGINATADEKSELESLFKSGVIL